MMNNHEQQTKQMIEQGKQMTAGFVSSGEMVIDADPEKGFFRVKLRNVQPPSEFLMAVFIIFSRYCRLHSSQCTQAQDEDPRDRRGPM